VALVRLEHLRKSYGTQRVVDVPALAVAQGEFFSLLGPSGCGKTTTLRCIAGLAEPDSGRIVIGDRDVSTVPTRLRNVGMVFQKYALFPHLTVRENVAYGLEGRGLGADALNQRIRDSLDLVALDGFDARLPHQLSGGQQQRVAMARAIAYRPDVLLLDEPFSNLDVKLRATLRADLRRLQQSLAITTIFVTHDQQEALSLSDRIAVMNEGRIEQVGRPQEIYESPASAFVADFVGATNLLRATLVEVNERGAAWARINGQGRLALPNAGGLPAGTEVTLMVKPERVRVSGDPSGDDVLTGDLAGVSYFGSGYSYAIIVGGQRIEARQPDAASINERRAGPGDRIAVHIDAAVVRVVRA
jgi:putative spermidine/putrescine transport system ATP-binding protein